jgi:hypothetical protein
LGEFGGVFFRKRLGNMIRDVGENSSLVGAVEIIDNFVRLARGVSCDSTELLAVLYFDSEPRPMV